MIERAARPLHAILTAAVLAICVAGLGALATDLGPWYQQLRKPVWMPPDWVFGPAWTLIFGLTALSAVQAWHNNYQPQFRRRLLWLFGINGVLNILWSVLFFRFKRPDWALVEVVFLWLSVAALVIFLIRARNRGAAGLLVPYLAWVTFAAVLNWSVVRLNPVG